MRLRAPAAAAIAAIVAVCLAVLPNGGGVAHADDLLRLTATTTYDVKTGDGAVKVAWDVSVLNDDPDTAYSNSGQIFFYEALALPVLRGAADLSATDSAGHPLTVTTDDLGGGVAVRAKVEFASPLFYGETYAFRMAYTMPPDARSEGVVITPSYAFIPAIGAGDQATVVVNTPAGEPWEVSVEPQDCASEGGNTFTCSGSENGYLAALVEVSQPGATATTNFEVPMDGATLSVSLTYFQGEDAAAAHQQQLITAGLPVIEDVYGFAYDGPAVVSIAHGGRQAVLGYEGLTSCGADACDVVISPLADDYTVLHEMAHLWSDIYARRWLSEGFAELVSHEAAAQLPELVTGPPPERAPSTVELQLDDWGGTESLIGADDAELAEVNAGYDYSLRFLDELRTGLGIESLQAVNRNLSTGGAPADSRRFMDLLEEATAEDLDAEFLLWVFPSSYEPLLADRREAKGRLLDLRSRLTEQGLPLDITTPIENNIRDWAFSAALVGLDEAEANLDTYAELRGSLDVLRANAQNAGLVLPLSLATDLDAFRFEDVRAAMAVADGAIDAYVVAERAVDGSRTPWERFGLLGSDPDGELNGARDAFEAGEFDRSREKAERAEELINDASSVAFKRLLVVAGFFGLLVLALAIAFAVGHFRERALAER